VSIIFGFLINWKIPVFCVAAPLGWYIFGSGVFVTTLSHIKTPISYRNFETEDNSQNNKWIHWYTLGEGLHNNHHAHPEEYNQAMRKGEFDFSGWLVKTIFIVDSNDKNAHKLK
jgi:stearoyl-CoA desaturase (delta-9 desaturase)